MDIHAPAGAEETAEAISAPEVEEAAPAKRQGIGKKIYIPALLVPLLAIVGFVAIYVFNLWGNREAEPLKPAEVVDEKVAPEPADTAAVEETTQTPAPAEPARGAPDKPKPELPGAKPTAAESDKLKAAPRPQAKPQPQAKAALEAGAGAKAPVSTHFVQFGYFGAEENASRLSLKLKGMGLKIRVAEEQGKAKTFYRVVLDEAFASEEAARQRAADIKSTHGVDAIALSRAD
jgi:cell division protein FtsN